MLYYELDIFGFCRCCSPVLPFEIAGQGLEFFFVDLGDHGQGIQVGVFSRGGVEERFVEILHA